MRNFFNVNKDYNNVFNVCQNEENVITNVKITKYSTINVRFIDISAVFNGAG